MPTVGWIQEDAQDRLTDAFPFQRSEPVLVPCPFCEEAFLDPMLLRQHLGLRHPIARPVFLLGGQSPVRGHIQRTPLPAGEVTIGNATSAQIKRNNGGWVDAGIDELPQLLEAQLDGMADIRLQNERLYDGRDAVAEHRIRFRVAAEDQLAEVDAIFVRNFTGGPGLTQAAIEDFLAEGPQDYAVQDYARALADYLMGLLIKEGRIRPEAPVKFSEFGSKMKAAHRVLSVFRRRVSQSVCACVQFSLNDFGSGSPPQEIGDFAGVFEFFAAVREGRKTGKITEGSNRPAQPICPLDDVSYQLLTAARKLAEGDSLNDHEAAALAKIERRSATLSEMDLIKMRVILAESEVRRSNFTGADRHLKALEHHPLFGQWARDQQQCLNQ